MHLAVVTTSYPAHAGDGAGCFVRAEALARRDAGDRVTVLCPDRGSVARDRGIAICSVPGGDAFGWPGVAARLRHRPWRALDACRFIAAARAQLSLLCADAVQAHWLVPAWPVAARGTFRLEVVAHGGDVRLLLASPRLLREQVLARIVARGATVRFVAHSLRSALLASLARPLSRQLARQSFVRPCPLPALGIPRPRRAVRGELGIADETPLALSLGRLVASKHVERSVAACAALGVGLVVAGDGPERSRLEATAPESVSFLGQLPRDRALDLIAAVDLLVDASSAEGAPTAIREARALGTHVVSCGAGDTSSWARRDPGITMTSPDRLAEAIAATLALSHACSPRRPPPGPMRDP